MLRQFELVDRVKSYDPKANEDLLNRAYVYAMKAHGTQTRESGDSYFSHPLEVAGILTNWHLDSITIATALLHDTVEDTLVTLEDIHSIFGEEIASLVDGVTKLSRLKFKSDQDKQAENFRKFILAMSKDLRVLLVKLADRIHNMRTLKYVKSPEKRQRIARETMEIYAPLAERIGMHEIRSELEDLSFAELHSEIYASISHTLEHMRKKEENLITQVIEKLHEILSKEGISSNISGREKSPYSIWRKMQRKNITLEQLSDIIALRILVKNLSDCFHVLGCIHSIYSMIPGRFKDYISVPKDNGYQSLHTTIIGPFNHPIEIQIRTYEMHDIAEMGVAAHWNYKEQNFTTNFLTEPNSEEKVRKEGSQYRWVRELLEILEQTSTPKEVLESTKLEMFADQVFCFTPINDIIPLSKGSTPVDFAYAIHSSLGERCIGAIVNGKPASLETILENGDQVEIITAKNQPSPSIWKRFIADKLMRPSIRKTIPSKQSETLS